MADRRDAHGQRGVEGPGSQSPLFGRVGRAIGQAATGRPCTEPRTRRFTLTRAFVGLFGAIAIAGCGATNTTPTTKATTAAATGRSSASAWEPGTPPPKVTPVLISQAGYGLTTANANLGTVDEVFGAVPANVHVNPSAKALNGQYARFGRCMAEHMKIHDLGHELALLIAYNQGNLTLQAAVEKASSVCTGLAITPNANYRQSLRANP